MTVHYFTVDVEEHFQVSALQGAVRREDWGRLESRVGRNVDRLLGLLQRHGTRGTFFTLGWIAEHHPGVVRAIAEAGHEVASHGYGHERVTALTPDQFRADVRRAKALLEDVTGRAVTGYRAPSFSIVPGGEWAFDVLLEEGYRYDSSLFPIRRPGGYGYPAAPSHPYWIERPAGRLLELPLTTWRLAGQRLPASGGAYFRVLPYALTDAAFRDSERRRAPGVFYVHPWEVDPEQPRFSVKLTSRLRHYTGLHRTLPRLERLLAAHRFGPIADGGLTAPTG